MMAGETTCKSFWLTVAEGKRLIAKGVAQLPCVKRAMESGMVVVTKGTTAGYVVEELLGKAVDRMAYCLGKTLPSGHPERARLFSGDLSEFVLRNGEVIVGMDLGAGLAEVRAGDVVIKGANALDYERGLVGHLIGHPTGGTMGKVLGCVHGRQLHFVCPVGLEKQVAGSLMETTATVTGAAELAAVSPGLWVMPAEIVTELEAVNLLTGASAMQIAAGGVLGAEGACWIMATGSPEQMADVERLVDEVQGEPSLLEYAEQMQGKQQ
jgi:hypothetical protein